MIRTSVMSRHGFLALVALGALSASVAAAETELEMEQVVVTATRTPTAILDSPDNVTVITGEEIAAGGALTAAEALARVAGVEIADSGTTGSVKSIRIRGAASSQVLVLIDGVRMNDSQAGATDLSLLPVEMIERIEVVRGGTSALYGADALGGVVNIITKSRAEHRFTLSVSNGSYIPHAAVEVSDGPTETPVDANWFDLADTQRIALQASGAAGRVDLLATGSFTRAGNGFVWNDTQYIGDWRRLINSSLLEGSAFVSATSRAESATLGFKGQFDYSSTLVPGTIDSTSPYFSTDAAQQRAYLQGQIFFTDPSLTSSLGLEARAYYKLTRLAYQDPPTDDVHILHSLGVEVQQQASFVDFLQLVYGGSFLADLAESTWIGSRQRLSGGAFLEVPLFLGERFILTPVARCDLYSDFPGSLTWKVGAVLRLSDTLSLKAGGGKSYRAPTLNDLHSPWGMGNPDLQPETGYNGELGLALATDNAEVSASAFVRYVLDGIQWSGMSVSNIGEALFPGAEASFDIELLPGLSLRGSYTFLYSFVLRGAIATYTFEDDKRAVYAPVHSADAALRYDSGKTRLGIDASIAAGRFTDEANTPSLALPAHVVLNADARQQLSRNLAVSLAVKNLLNTVYQSVSGYIMPPLSFWLGLEAKY